MKNKVKIALLDTGINVWHPYLKNIYVKSYEVVNLRGAYEIVSLEDINSDNNGHGTACASVMKKECANIEIYSFKILNDKGICNLQMLETVLSYINYLDIKLINLSLAIEEHAMIRDLSKICNELKLDGKIIISSLGNHRKKSYPAILKDCIGVQGFILNSADSIWFNQFKKIQCIIDSTPFFHCDNKDSYSMFGKCNSYASAKLTGIIAAILYENNNFDTKQIFSNLASRADKKHWCQLDLRKSKRFPDLNLYKNQVNQHIVKEIENILKEYLKLDADISLKGKLLLSSEVGLLYEHCYDLIKSIEKIFDFTVKDYTSISREDFYSIESISHLVHIYSNKGR